MERDTWTQKADFPGTARNSAVAMAVDEKGYLEPDTTVPIT